MSDKPSPPLVKDDRVTNTHVCVGTNVWFNHWLTNPELTSFRFECPEGSFTARRRKGDYWNGYRKVKGKLRQEYLGKSSDLTQTKLIETARTLAMDNVLYWRMKYPRPDNQSSDTGLYNRDEACITDSEDEVSKLKAVLVERDRNFEESERQRFKLKTELEEAQEAVFQLQQKLAQAEAEVASLQLKRKQDLEFSHVRAVGLSAEIEKLKSPSRWEVEPADILNQLRQRDKKSKVSLKDVEAIVSIISSSIEPEAEADEPVLVKSSWQKRVDAVVGAL